MLKSEVNIELYKRLYISNTDIEPEFSKIVDNNFWELIDTEKGDDNMSNEMMKTTIFCLGCGKRFVEILENETNRLIQCPCCNLIFTYKSNTKESWKYITNDTCILLHILDEDTIAIGWDSGNDSNHYIFNVYGDGDITNYEAIVKELIDTVTIPSLIEEIQVFFDGCQKVGRYGNN